MGHSADPHIRGKAAQEICNAAAEITDFYERTMRDAGPIYGSMPTEEFYANVLAIIRSHSYGDKEINHGKSVHAEGPERRLQLRGLATATYRSAGSVHRGRRVRRVVVQDAPELEGAPQHDAAGQSVLRGYLRRRPEVHVPRQLREGGESPDR